MGRILGKNVRSYPAENGQVVFWDGVNTENIEKSNMSSVMRIEPITVVLVAGEIGDYAAYIGIGSPEFVKNHGDKLSFTEANIHFCGQLEEEKYRA